MQSPTRSTRWTTLALLLLVAGGCSRKKPDGLRHAPRSTKQLPTTAAAIWLANLDAQIGALEGRAAGPDLLVLSAAHHLRGRYRGDLDEIQHGIDLLACAPTDASCFQARADQEQSLHRFGAAEADLRHASHLAGREAGATRTAALQADLDWNAGRYAEAIPAIRAARAAHPATGTWIREAQLEHELGNEHAADVAYEKAEDAVTDTGPLVVAHLDVQRGMQKVDTGRLDEAVVFFRAAVERMPDWVTANEHLAEVLAMDGKDDEALRIYERVVRLSDDPEFAHALAALYAKRGRAEEAKALTEKARARYEVLLAKYPEAMYWHASEFFLAVGDAPRAVDLLTKNVALRPNSTSLVALARAKLAAHQDARPEIDRALAMPPVSARLFWTASKVHAGKPEAVGFARRAKEMNPRIAEDD